MKIIYTYLIYQSVFVYKEGDCKFEILPLDVILYRFVRAHAERIVDLSTLYIMMTPAYL